jgi:hypothetical protein
MILFRFNCLFLPNCHIHPPRLSILKTHIFLSYNETSKDEGSCFCRRISFSPQYADSGFLTVRCSNNKTDSNPNSNSNPATSTKSSGTTNNTTNTTQTSSSCSTSGEPSLQTSFEAEYAHTYDNFSPTPLATALKELLRNSLEKKGGEEITAAEIRIELAKQGYANMQVRQGVSSSQSIQNRIKRLRKKAKDELDTEAKKVETQSRNAEGRRNSADINGAAGSEFDNQTGGATPICVDFTAADNFSHEKMLATDWTQVFPKLRCDCCGVVLREHLLKNAARGGKRGRGSSRASALSSPRAVPCRGCDLVYYCSVNCLNDDKLVHHPACLNWRDTKNEWERERRKLRTEKQIKAKDGGLETVDFLQDKRTRGRLWQFPETHAFMKAYSSLCSSAIQIGSVPALYVAVCHETECLRLSRTDNMGVGQEVPHLMLRLGMIQEAYDWVKWWSLNDAELWGLKVRGWGNGYNVGCYNLLLSVKAN